MTGSQWDVPISAVRCTVVEFPSLRRCIMMRGHGGVVQGAGGYHHFDNGVRQDVCLSWLIVADTGRIRFCSLPIDHTDGCVFLWLTERPVRLDDVIPLRG